MVTKSEILSALKENIKIPENTVVMVHSSYKSLRGVSEGPDGLIDAVQEFVGDNGTVLIPTFNFTCWPDEHYYDILESPSEMGVVTEFARMRKEFKRTPHPIYSFAVCGKHQNAFVEAPSLSTMGENSVFELFHRLNGLIISIGLDYNDSFTFVHHVEYSANAKHRRVKDFGGVYLDSKRNISNKKFQMYVRSTKKSKTFVNPALEVMEKEGIINNFLLGNAKIDYSFAQEYYSRCFSLVSEDPKLFYKE